MQKKLLFLGIDTSTHDALLMAKELGIYSIVTDYNTPKLKPEKAEADEYWMTDVADTDALYERCLAEHIDGVFAGTNEFCLDKAKELCGRLELPFYASDKGWRCARDKVYFKELCAECGLDTPKTYMTEGSLDDIDISRIAYPVIVKPSDSCAMQGISICNNAGELEKAYEYALSVSHNKRIIIEDYIVGDEVAADYYVVDYKPYLSYLNTLIINRQTETAGGLKYRHENEAVQEHENEAANEHEISVRQDIGGADENISNAAFTISLQQSRYKKDFNAKCGAGIEKLMRLIDFKTGPFFLQAIVRNGRYYFLEFGGRLTGIGSWSYEEYYYKMSKLRMAVMHAAGMEVNAADAERIGRRTYYSMIYMPWLRSGVIKSISGIDEISRMEGAEFILNRYRPGDTVDSTGSMYGMACYLALSADNLDKLTAMLNKVNNTLKVISDKGEDMLVRFTDTERIRGEYA